MPVTKKINPNIDEILFVWAETIAASMGFSMSEFINYLIKKEVDGLTADERKFLQDWRKKKLSEAQGVNLEEEPPATKRRKSQ